MRRARGENNGQRPGRVSVEVIRRISKVDIAKRGKKIIRRRMTVLRRFAERFA